MTAFNCMCCLLAFKQIHTYISVRTIINPSHHRFLTAVPSDQHRGGRRDMGRGQGGGGGGTRPGPVAGTSLQRHAPQRLHAEHQPLLGRRRGRRRRLLWWRRLPGGWSWHGERPAHTPPPPHTHTALVRGGSVPTSQDLSI